jgi:nucleoside-diphosphate-sugar epimerase
MADRVLVTGISGFLGGHVARALLDQGYAVRGSLRDLARADSVRAALKAASANGNVDGLDFVALDLSADAGWKEAMEGCRYLQHVASPFVVVMPADKQELIRPAVEGTRRALTAALNAGVERIVLTSSFAAIGYGHPRDRTAPFTEADWSNTEGEGITAYTESKTLAELEAWSIMETAGRRADLAVVNPTAILGPLIDNDPGTSNDLLLRLFKGGVPLVPRISFGFVDVRDVAALEVNAMQSPDAGGKRFIATAGTLSFKQIGDILRPAFPAYAGKFPRFELPDWLARLMARRNAELRDNLHLIGLVRGYDNRQALALLGHPFISPPDAVLATGHSLVERGLA